MTFDELAQTIDGSWRYSWHWKRSQPQGTALTPMGFRQALGDCERQRLHFLRRLSAIEKARAYLREQVAILDDSQSRPKGTAS